MHLETENQSVNHLAVFLHSESLAVGTAVESTEGNDKSTMRPAGTTVHMFRGQRRTLTQRATRRLRFSRNREADGSLALPTPKQPFRRERGNRSLKTAPSAQSVKRVLVLHCSGSVARGIAFMVILHTDSGGVKQALGAATAAAGTQCPFHSMVERMAGGGGRGGSCAF